jgi:hypothetical protein
LADCTIVVIGELGWMALFEYFVRTGTADGPFGQCSAEMTVRMHMLMQYFAGKMAQHHLFFKILL